MIHPNVVRKVKKMLGTLLALGLASTVAALGVNRYVYSQGQPLIQTPEQVRNAEVAMVFGAYVLPNGTPSSALADRLVTALDLYRDGKVSKFLLTAKTTTTRSTP